MATPTSLPATFVAGNVLTAAQMNDLRGAFRILQVVRATDSTSRSTTSTSYVDASISVTITPTSADSDILLVWTALGKKDGSATEIGYRQITDSSNVTISGAEDGLFGQVSSSDVFQYMTLVGFDSPATTSATTYKGRFRTHSSGGTVELLNNQATGQMFALEVSA